MFIQKGRFSHLPGGCFWATAMGITESTATFDIPMSSPDRATSPLPGRRDPALHLQRPHCPQTAQLCSRPQGLQPLAGRCSPGRRVLLVELALLRRPTSAALATSDSPSPSPRAAVPAPHREPDCGGLSVFVEIGPGDTASQSRLPGM